MVGLNLTCFMSGHSHYSTIKRQKGLKDAAKGKVFSKMAMAIQIAVKTGGGGDPDGNSKLRVAIEQARAVNMPKANIDRAISAASAKAANVEEITYEGFGPAGIGILVVVATDNRNRTAQEIKNMFEKVGGSMGGPNSVAFNFDSKGLILLAKDMSDSEGQMLKLIDAGVEDIEEAGDVLEVYVAPDKLFSTKNQLSDMGFSINSFELIKKPINFVAIGEVSQAQKVLNFLETLEDHDDVQKVFANVDIPQDVLDRIESK